MPETLKVEDLKEGTGAVATAGQRVTVHYVGTLTDGTQINGPDDLSTALLARTDLFVTNFTRRLMTYALGRKVEYYDMPQVRKVVSDAASEDFRFSALVREIALSDVFTHRTKGGGEGEAVTSAETAQR